MNVVKLTQKLIEIPSFVNNQQDESVIAEFIFKYLSNFSFLKIENNLLMIRKKDLILLHEHKEIVSYC